MRVMIKIDAAFGRNVELMEINGLMTKYGIGVQEVINITIDVNNINYRLAILNE